MPWEPTNLRYWDTLRRPPATALKKIGGGRLRGMTDIKPQWRFEAMTSCFGPCGVGWRYIIGKMWTEQLLEGEVMCFCNVELYYKENDIWSDGIPGTGGSMLVAKEKGGLHSNDEGFKMALTDALGVAMKSIGVASDIYMGAWDGSKYTTPPPRSTTASPIKSKVFGCKDQAALYELLCQWDERRPLSVSTAPSWKETVDRVDEMMKERGWEPTKDISMFVTLVNKAVKEVQDESA